MPGSEAFPTSFRSVGYPVRVHSGENALARLPDEVDRVGAKRAFVVCGRSVAHHTGLLDRVREALGGRLVGVFDGTEAGSPLPSVERGVSMAAEAAADAIIGVGGGSAAVTARAIVILLAEAGTPWELATQYPAGQQPVSPRLMQPKLPNFLVPTTPTTAATRSGTAVIDPDIGHRLEFFDPKTRPVAVFWDSDAMLTASPDLTLSAAASCYSGLVGALQAEEQPNPLAEGDLLQALNLMHANLPLVISRPEDGQVRINLAAAAFLYNRAGDSGASNSGFGVVTALAHSLDTRYSECSHGAAYAILTAPGMRFNAAYNTQGQARLATVMGLGGGNPGDGGAAEEAACAVEETYSKMNLPGHLREVGVPEAGLKSIADDAMTDFGLHRNIRPVKTSAELEQLLRTIW